LIFLDRVGLYPGVSDATCATDRHRAYFESSALIGTERGVLSGTAGGGVSSVLSGTNGGGYGAGGGATGG